MNDNIFVPIYRYSILTVTVCFSAFITTVILSKKNLRNLPHYCILALIFCALLENCATFIFHYEKSSSPTDPLCLLQGWLFVFGEVATYLWTVIISYQIAESIISGTNYDTSFIKHLLFSSVIGILIPVVFATYLLLSDQIGPSGSFCYIASWEKEGHLVTFLIVYIFFWSVFLINLFLTCYVISGLREQFTDDEQEDLEDLIFRYRMYPIVQLICLVPGSAVRITELITGRRTIYGLWVMFIFGMAKPLIYILTYGLTPAVMAEIKPSRQSISSKVSQSEYDDSQNE